MDNPALWISLLFAIGYIGIIFEHIVRVDKAAIALIMGVGCWFLYFNLGGENPHKYADLGHHLADITQVLFFLMGAMLIVEVIDAHHGFETLGSLLRIRSKWLMFWVALFIAFFVSAALDNLTTIIVMITLLKKLIPDTKQRVLFSTALVVAVNAGGAWTPIGDVTTTMLWIAERITTENVIKALFIPSLVSLIVFGLLIMPQLPKQIDIRPPDTTTPRPVGGKVVFAAGVLSLLMVPVWKAFFGLPPFLGVTLGVATLWVITDLTHYNVEERQNLRIYHSFGRIDMACIFFFFGMLLAVDAMEASGALRSVAKGLEESLGSQTMIAVMIGLVSAIVDNIPLVAAVIQMYPLTEIPVDHTLWLLIAFTAGTGGSILIIGSAAGVAAMSLEKVSFGWYVKHLSWAALLAYLAGVGTYVLMYGWS